MSSDLKIQGVVEMSSEGAERALDRVGDKAGQMASRLEKEAGKAGKAVDGIGDGAGKSADEFTRAEGKIVASIKRTTQSLEQLGKTASQKIELRIADRGLDSARFEPMLAKLRELESAQNRVVTSGRGFGSGLQNTSYQLQDFIVQVNGGTDATKALGQQLPQMLVGFGAAGAAVGVLAALLPNIIQAFGSSASGAKNLGDAMGDFGKAIGAVGESVKQFDMDKVYEEFNKASGATRGAIVEQLRFQQAFIDTSRLVASKKFGESLGGVGEYGTLDKLAGAFGSSGAERLAKQLGVGLETAKNLLPTLSGLKSGTEDVNNAFNRFGTVLLGGNAEAVKLASNMAELAKAERDAASASSTISEAQAKMATGHVQTKKDAEAAAKATKALASEQAALDALVDTINGKSSAFDASYVKNVETLLAAYGRGALSLGDFNDVFARYVAMQPGAVAAAKEQAKAGEDYAKALSAALDPLEKQASALEREVATYGMTEAAIQGVTVARMEEARAIAAANGAYPEHLDFLDQEIELRKRIATASSQKDFLEANKKAAQQSSREWEKVTDDINRSLTDALMRGFDAGKSFGDNFADSLKASLKTLVIRLVVNMVGSSTGSLVSTVTDAVLGTRFSASSPNSGSGSNLLGMASNLSTAYSASSYVTGAAAAYAQYQAGLPVSQWALSTYAPVSTGVSTSGVAANSMAGSSGTTGAASTVAWVAAIVAGMWMSSQAWKAGIRWENYAKEPESKYDLEVYLRAQKDKPMAALFGKDFVNSEFYAVMSGSALSAQIHYALQGALFGKTRVTGSQINGAFSEAEQGFTGQQGVSYKKSGGLFSRSKEWTEWSSLPAEVDGAMDMIYRGVRNSFIMLGEVFQDSSLAQKMQGFVYSFTVGELSIDSVSNGLTEMISARLTPAINAAAKAGETFQQTFQRVVSETSATQRAFDVMGRSLIDTFGQNNLNGILAASDAFIQLFGSVDAFNQSFDAYFSNYFTAQEKTARGWADMIVAFDQIGVAMPVSRAAFRALVDSLDLSSAGGRATFKSLMDLQAGFAALTPTLEDATAAAQAMTKAAQEMQASQIGALYAAQRKAQEDAIKLQITQAATAAATAQDMIDSFRSISENLGNYRDTLRQGASGGNNSYAIARGNYQSVSAQALLGNVDAAQSLQAVAETFLQASRDVGTAGSYARDLAGVIATVDNVVSVADRQIPIAEQQLAAATVQTEILQAILSQMTGGGMPTLVANYQQAATDFAAFFGTTSIGQTLAIAGGTMQRISDSMGLFVDAAGKGSVFSQSDTPYTLASASDAYRQYLLQRYGAWNGPSFASGGYHSGGLRLVGERGPELEFTGPSQILSAGDTAALLSGGGLAVAVAQLSREVSELRAESRAAQSAIAANTAKSARLLDKFDVDGMPEVRAA
jgi:hypothetical protein